MLERSHIVQAIFEAIDEFNETQPSENQLEKSESVIFFGRDGKVDSLGLVNLVLAVEEKIRDTFSTEISLMDEKAMSYKNSPFRSLESMTDYIHYSLENSNV